MRRAAGIMALCVMVGTPGCGDDSETTDSAGPGPRPTIKKVESKQRPKVPQPIKKQYSYSPVGKRDPFRSYLADLKENETGKERPQQATELFELNQYRLTGLITGTSQPKAMVEDPEGVGHVLRVGSRVGKNGGRVTRIYSQGIVVVEEFINPVGQRVRVPITLKLPEDINAIAKP